jgi:hypothetical protein
VVRSGLGAYRKAYPKLARQAVLTKRRQARRTNLHSVNMLDLITTMPFRGKPKLRCNAKLGFGSDAAMLGLIEQGQLGGAKCAIPWTDLIGGDLCLRVSQCRPCDK